MSAFALCTAGTATSRNLVLPQSKKLTLTQTIKWQQRIIRHDKWVIHTRRVHTSVAVKFARMQLWWTSKELKETLAIQHSRLLRRLASAMPPHHALWMCIHNQEAGNWQDPNSGGNGHYGGLQMHPGWGYGTSYYASQDSQLTQEWAAERGYRASGYSRSWLMGQWYHPNCIGYS